MADNSNQMTMNEAIEILKLDSFINYAEEDILEAVRLVKGDQTQSDVLKSFYERYFGMFEVDFHKYNENTEIFAGTDYQLQYNETMRIEAEEIAEALVSPESSREKLSFAQLDQAQAAFKIFPPQDKKAENFLRNNIKTKLLLLIDGKEKVDVHNFAVVQRLIDQADASVKDKAQKALDNAIKSYEDENGLSSDKEVLQKNDQTLSSHLEQINLYQEGKLNPALQELSPQLDKLEIVDDDKVLGEEEKQQHLTMMFEAAKLEAYMANIGKMDYLLSTSRQTQRQSLLDDIKVLFAGKIGLAGIVSEIQRPSKEDLADRESYYKYKSKRSESAAENWAKINQSADKVRISTQDVITVCADSDVELTAFQRNLEGKIGKNKGYLGQKLASFRDKAIALWGNRYEIARGIAKNMKENKERITVNTIFTLGMGAAVAGGTATVAGIAIGGYAAYSAVSGYFWPLFKESKKLREEAKKNNQELSLGASFKQAWNNLKNDKKYKTERRFGLVAGAVGGFLGVNSIGSQALTAASAKAYAMLARTFSGFTAQLTTAVAAEIAYKKEVDERKKEQLRQERNAARTSLAIGFVASGIAAWLSLDRLNAQNSNEVAQDVVDIVQEAPAADLTQTATEDKVGLIGRAKEWWSQWRAGRETNTSDTAENITYQAVAKDSAAVEIDAKDPTAVKTVDSVATNTNTQEVASTAPVVAEQVSEPQYGDVLDTKDHGNGIVETITKGRNGIDYKQVTGLKGEFETSAATESFYQRRIMNMNQFNKLVEVLPTTDGQSMTAAQATEAMLKQIEIGAVELPDGVSPAHAIHTAYMHAHYTGDMSALKALACPNGEDTVDMFTRIVPKYSTDNGFIGLPVNGQKMPMQAGTVDVEKLCVPQEGREFIGVSQAADIPVSYTPEFTATDYKPEIRPVVSEYYGGGLKEGQNSVTEVIVMRDGEPVNNITSREQLQAGDKITAVVAGGEGKETRIPKRYIEFKEVPYKEYDDSYVAGVAESLKVKPNTLTQMENGDWIKVTNDGIVHMDTNPETGRVSVTLTDLDGKSPVNAPVERQHHTVMDAVRELNNVNRDKSINTIEEFAQEMNARATASSTTSQGIQQIINSKFGRS